MIVEKHLKPELGGTQLVKLTLHMIQQYMNGKRTAGLSARTIQYHHAVLRNALGLAERWGKVTRNVARLVSPPRIERLEGRPLSPSQARVLLEGISLPSALMRPYSRKTMGFDTFPLQCLEPSLSDIDDTTTGAELFASLSLILRGVCAPDRGTT